MSKRYIQIDSVDDIDTSRITVSNINDRYIDRKGNRFATRFNLRTKKIQIVRIALGQEEARKSRGVIIQGLVRKKINENIKKHHDEIPAEGEAEAIAAPDNMPHDELMAPDIFDIDTFGQEIPAATANHASTIQPESRKKPPDWLAEEGIQPAGMVNHGELLALIPENYNLLSERIFGVINNVKNSGIMTKVAEIDDAIDFTNIFDHFISPKMEETKKFLVEFEKYAERPEHYYTMIEKPFRNYLMKLSESEIMDFLKAYFVGQYALEVLEKTREFIHSVREKTSANSDSIADPAKKQFLTYAYSTCDFLTQYIKEEAAKFYGWLVREKVF